MGTIKNVVHSSDWMKITEITTPVDLSGVQNIDQLDVNILNVKKDVEIDIDGVIGGSMWEDDDPSNVNTREKMKKELRYLAEMKAEKITVNINSVGGSFSHAIAIHDMLAMHKAAVTTKVFGMTASAATIIAQAGNDRQMSENALYLVHRGAAGIIAMLNQNKVREISELLKVIDNKIIDIYEKRTGKSRAELETLLDASNGDGRWLDSKEALKYGLVDTVFEPMKTKTKPTIKQLQNFKLPIPTNMTQEAENKSLLDQFKAFVNETFGEKKPEKEEEQAVQENSQEPEQEEKPVEEPVNKVETEQVVVDNSVELQLRNELEVKNVRIQELETELAKLNAKSTKVVSAAGIEDKESINGDPVDLALAEDLKKFRNEMAGIRYEN